MCLSVVTSRERDRKREGFGWKVFSKSKNGNLFGDCVKGFRRVGIWLKSKDNKSEGYPLGFHILRTRREARFWKAPNEVIRKVKFRDILAEGTQNHWSDFRREQLRIIVAKEMFILEN